MLKGKVIDTSCSAAFSCVMCCRRWSLVVVKKSSEQKNEHFIPVGFLVAVGFMSFTVFFMMDDRFLSHKNRHTYRLLTLERPVYSLLRFDISLK
jgi:hypothetical protein